MDTSEKIELGDKVSVNFHGAQTTLLHKAEVLHIPQATGDSWIFRGIPSCGTDIHYVSEGCTIRLLEKHRND